MQKKVSDPLIYFVGVIPLGYPERKVIDLSNQTRKHDIFSPKFMEMPTGHDVEEKTCNVSFHYEKYLLNFIVKISFLDIVIFILISQRDDTL